MTDYDIEGILANLKKNLKCKSEEEFKHEMFRGMLIILLFRYIIACNVVVKEEENLRLIFILFTILLAQTLFYIDLAECY